MTLISTHRSHSYKRNSYPKKLPFSVTLNMISERSNSKVVSKAQEHLRKVFIKKHAMVPQTIHIWGIAFCVELPKDSDLYSGLQRWYPEIYEAAIQEDQATNTALYDTIDDAWDRADYQEWLCD
jgi:hypothetical protein